MVTSCWQKAFFFFFTQTPRQRIRSAQAGPVSEPGESAQIAAPGGEGMNKAEGPTRKLNGLLLGFVALCRPPFQWEDNFFSKCRSKNSINYWLVNSQELSAGKEEICSAAAASSCKRAREWALSFLVTRLGSAESLSLSPSLSWFSGRTWLTRTEQTGPRASLLEPLLLLARLRRRVSAK